MPTQLRIEAAGRTLRGELGDTECARLLAERLPIEGRARTWGEEVYFDTGVDAPLDETAAEVVELGSIGYWPTGRAICFFFGLTPMSRPGEIRPASAVNVVGRLEGDLDAWKEIRDNEPIRVAVES